MAKLFEPNKKKNYVWYNPNNFFRLFSITIVFIALIIFIIVREEKRERENINRKDMGMVHLLEMDNGNILTREVRYSTIKKVDPEDTSDVFYEVIVGDKKYKEGMLIKFNHRFIQPQQIEGTNYCVIQADQIQFHLRKENVKEDILKR